MMSHKKNGGWGVGWGLPKNVTRRDSFLTGDGDILVSGTPYNLKNRTKGNWIRNFLGGTYKIREY